MLTYKAMFKFVDGGGSCGGDGLSGVIACGRDLDEARRLLAGALVDMAETNLIHGEPLPQPDPLAVNPDADLDEPIHLLVTAASRVASVPQVTTPCNGGIC